jgi:hypothetical protein
VNAASPSLSVPRKSVVRQVFAPVAALRRLVDAARPVREADRFALTEAGLAFLSGETFGVAESTSAL